VGACGAAEGRGGGLDVRGGGVDVRVAGEASVGLSPGFGGAFL